MRFCRTILMVAAICACSLASAHAGLLGTYYNLAVTHPDMESSITGWLPGMVQSTLTGASPTLTPFGGAVTSQFDWWNPVYQVAQRVDADLDLQSNFASSWFPSIVNTGLPGDPYHFAVKWSGTFYVAADQSYTYSMGSDDDSWLFIDNTLVLDLGGIHGVTYDNQAVSLTAGTHTIDIFFAERHTSQSGFQLNFFSDLEPTNAIPEPGTLALFGLGLAGAALRRRLAKKA